MTRPGPPSSPCGTSAPRATWCHRRTAGRTRWWPRWPGQVERGMEKGEGKGHDVFRPGEHDGRITPRVTELAEMLSVIDGAKATDNLWGERWAKLSQNAMGNPVQAM